MDAELTLAEAAHILQPPMTERQLKAFARHLHWRAVGYRHTGKPGHPALTYPASQIMALHAALLPWLNGDASR